MAEDKRGKDRSSYVADQAQAVIGDECFGEAFGIRQGRIVGGTVQGGKQVRAEALQREQGNPVTEQEGVPHHHG